MILWRDEASKYNSGPARWEVAVDWRQWLIGANHYGRDSYPASFGEGPAYGNIFLGPLRFGWFLEPTTETAPASPSPDPSA